MRKFLFLMLLVGTAIASVTSTPTSTVTPGQYLLHTPDNLPPPPFTIANNRFDTLLLCQKAGESIGKTAKYKCDMSTAVSVTMVQTSTCSDEPAPKLYLSKVKNPEDGRDYWDLPGASFTDDTYIEMAELFVHNPAWPGGYPNCWVPGRAQRSDWRLNSKDEPGKAFMELRTSSMPPGDLVADEENSNEPVCPKENTDPRCPPWVAAS